MKTYEVVYRANVTVSDEGDVRRVEAKLQQVAVLAIASINGVKSFEFQSCKLTETNKD